MGVSLILGSNDFEKVADGTQAWAVSARYNFTTDKYSDFVVVNADDLTLTSPTAGDMYLHKGTTAITTAATLKAAADADVLKFITADDEIGKINTNNTVGYIVIVSEEDLSSASVSLAPTP